MRLFPPSCEGLHPAFPVAAPPQPASSVSSGVATAGLGVSVLAPVVLGVSRIFTRTRMLPWKLANTLTVWPFMGMVALGAFNNVQRHRKSSCFLKGEGLQPARARVMDLFGYFDMEDGMILGAAAGVLTARLLPRPWAVVGWRRWVGAGACGCGAVAWSSVIYLVLCNTHHLDNQALLNRAQKDAKRWVSIVHAANNRRRHSEQNGLPPPLMAFVTDMKVQLASSSSSPSSAYLEDAATVDSRSTGDLSRLPQYTVSQPEPQQNATIGNCTTVANDAAELASQIGHLRCLQEAMNREAEILWGWLAKKKAEFVSTDKSNDDATKALLARDIEALGNVQRSLWALARVINTRMAESQNRIKGVLSSSAVRIDAAEVALHKVNGNSRIFEKVLEAHLQAGETRQKQVDTLLDEFKTQSAIHGRQYRFNSGIVEDALTGDRVDAKIHDRLKTLMIEADIARADVLAIRQLLEDAARARMDPKDSVHVG